MRPWKFLVVAGAVLALAPGAPAAFAAGAYTLTATSPTGSYAPTFTGNGVLGVRVPPAGQGFAPGTVPALSELAGFYAVPNGPVPTATLQLVNGSTKQPDPVQQRGNIPTWSTLTFTAAGQSPDFTTAALTNWRQSIDLHTGVITTAYTWTAPNGDVTDLRYQVLTDRADPDLGLVQLQLIPHWSGAASVTDTIDGTPAYLSQDAGAGQNPPSHLDWVSIAADTTGITATLASVLQPSANAAVTAPPPSSQTRPAESVSQTDDFTVTAGQTYTFTKYVAVVSSQSGAATAAQAEQEAQAAATNGWTALLGANDNAWAALWSGRIDINGDSALATMVNASEFYLWSSTRAGVDWSVSPAGLSSNGYDGHIFWDAETWMFPSLLAMHPDLAAGMTAYRYQRLTAAEQHATATGYAGARFPWESALDGTEQIPPPTSVNSEGLYEMHITADIALAQWQYYLATGDRHWLATQGWPVISGAAAFWASKATPGAHGTYHIDGVTGPDEENPDVNDEAYTTWAAKWTLYMAMTAANVLRLHVPSSWGRIMQRIVVPGGSGASVPPEFDGYQGQLVKQADATLMQYPWGLPAPRSAEQATLNYYVPRTDPGGPSMSDAVNEIDTSAIGTPGCSSFVYTERSYQPFIRDPFNQFSETRTGGAFTFMTGIGGFLQEFIYGYSGLRFDSYGVTIAPSLTAQLPGITLRGLSWRGRTFDLTIGQRNTTVTLLSGPPLPVIFSTGRRVVRRGHPLTIPTRRPDLTRTSDLVRCGGASASSSQPGAPPLAAVDGSPATGWAPVSLPATLTLPVNGKRVGRVELQWGQLWPPAPGPNIHPPAGPVVTLRPSSYTLEVSTNGHSWRTVRTIGGRSGTLDVVRFTSRTARYVRIVLSGKSSALLEEVAAYAR